MAVLRQRGAAVRALVRPETNSARVAQLGVEVRPITFTDHVARAS